MFIYNYQFQNTTIMKQVKKIVLVMTVVLLGSIVMSAQPQRHGSKDPARMAQRRVERLDRQLNLTDEQKREIANILIEEMQSMPAQSSERVDEATMKSRREQMQSRRAQTDARIEALLTPEQAAKYAEVKRHEGPDGHRKHHRITRSGDSGTAACEGGCACKKDK